MGGCIRGRFEMVQILQWVMFLTALMADTYDRRNSAEEVRYAYVLE